MFIYPKAVIKAVITFFIISLLLLTSPGFANLTHAQSATDGFSEVDAYIKETMRRLPIKGLALAIVKGDEILYMQGYGIANTQGDPATPQTPWPMGSVTKSFTALAIRQLAAAGKLTLDTPLQMYIPEFHLSDPQASSAITLRHLIDHSSGISKDEGEAPYLNSPKTTFTEDLEHLMAYQPAYQPGEHEEYSNWNYVLLAEVVARVSGQPYIEYVDVNIFTPLGMSRSTFANHSSVPHAATGNLITFGISVPYREKFVPGMIGAGYLTSTSEDMAHYVSLLLGEGQYQGKSLLPVSGKGRFGPMWHWIQGNPTPDLVYGLSGGYNSFSTTCLTYPAQELGVVLLLNTRLDQLPGVSSYDIARGIGSIILGHPYQAPASSTLYKPWIILDIVIIFFITVIVWQVSRLKGWKKRYQSSKAVNKAIVWIGIVLSLLVGAAIAYLPTPLGTRWDTLLFMRPDIALPLIAIAALLGIIGVFKAIRSLF